MKYFLPYWEDWVHRDFDHINDYFSKASYDNFLFPHEIFDIPPYDGILISLGLFEFKLKLIKENGRPKIRNFENIRDYLRLPKNLAVFGDCGAFTYINKKLPQIDVKKAIYYYDSLGFDYAISVDHICSDYVITTKEEMSYFSFKNYEKKKDGKFKLILSEEEKEFRRQISIKNAEEFFKLSQNKKFTPIGAVQGYSSDTYIDSAKKLIDIGYQYIAFGGLVSKKTEYISKLLDSIYLNINTKKIKIHLLGVLREELISKMLTYNIESFDSASYYRKSWLKATNNYLGVDGKWYASIRIPQIDNQRLRNKIKDFKIDINKLRNLEIKLLYLLREYDKGKIKDVDSLVEEIIYYDKIFFRESFKENRFFLLYKNLLSSKIWKQCECKVCSNLGIDVVIFRGMDRNKRRGLHNTYLFFKNLKLKQEHFNLDNSSIQQSFL